MFLHLNGIPLHVQQSGSKDAPVLLLLHSLGTQAAIWEPVDEALSSRYRILRPDFRGHGLSGVTPGPYTVDGLAEDMLALLDAVGVDAAHVAGISLGGLVAQAMACQAPARVRSLALIDTALALPPAQMWLDRAALVRRDGIEPLVEPVVARWVTEAALASLGAQALRSMLRQTDPEGYAAAAEAVGAADFTQRVSALSVPTLVLVGDGDLATPPTSAEALRDAIPGARIEVIPDAAHIPTMEQPEQVVAALRQFLAALPA
jgi:3-oxoadipate enol-lactonase/4-carboxymuconolactone decarboxylase